MLKSNSVEDIVLALSNTDIDPRTGNATLYGVSWKADRLSMIGKVNTDWVRRELDWFFKGSNRLADMELPVPQLFQACAGTDGKVNSAYGHILFSRGDWRDGMNMKPPLFDRVVDTFINEGPGTRHAVAIISDRDVHTLSTFNGRNDFICTNALNFMIDADGRLHIIAQMRSMDAVFGYRADYSMWDALMEYLLGNLEMVYPDLRRGDIIFQVANLHVYPRHFDLLSRTAQAIDDARSAAVWAPATLNAHQPIEDQL
jgi:thymidylate synthase